MRLVDQLLSRARQTVQALRVAPSLPSELLQEVSAEEPSGGAVLVPRDEVLATHGHGDFATYEKLLSDDQVQPCFKQFRIEVVSREWHVDPGGEAELDKTAADDLRAQLTRIGWDQTCYKMLSGRMYGFNVGECMLSINESTGLVQLDRVLVRRPGRFAFATADRGLMLKQRGTHVALPAQKFWVFACGSDSDDDPYGSGLGQSLYWPVWFKRNGLKFWAIFLERFASPTPKATVPPGTTEADRLKLLTLLGTIMNGGRIVVPRGVDVELVQAIRSSGGDFEQFCTRMDRAIAKIILLQTMTTDDGSSLSQAQVHESVLTAAAKADSDLLDESFARGPATWLTEWNYPRAKVPVVYRDFAAAIDLKAIAERDEILNRIGWAPTEQYVKSTYGDNYERAPRTPAPVSAVSFAEALATAPNPFATPDGWTRVMGPEVTELEKILATCRTYTDVKRRLTELVHTDPAEFTELMARALFLARGLGEAGGELD